MKGLPDLGRCRVMGVLNVTPDSFSDGGQWFDRDAAIAHGLELAAQGADLVDVGGESTRPGAARVSEEEELDRVLDVIATLAQAGVIVSIDTMRASVAQAALLAGAAMVNDVSGGLADEQLPHVVADAGVPYVVMHWRGHADHMQERADYRDVTREVCAELQQRLDAVVAAGVDIEQVIVDPGLGFAKRAEHNWALLAQFEELLKLRRPVLVGPSRKSFLGALLADDAGAPRPADERDHASHALTALMAYRGAWGVRVHDVAPSADAVRVVAAVRASEDRT